MSDLEELGYLAQPHTLRNMRRLWQPRFFGREMWEDWEAAGKPEPRERARERLLRILEEHVPAPLPDGVEDRILEVIAEHERKAEGAD
jgi:trimethylamine:corrinoid methyltransferase-like protein